MSDPTTATVPDTEGKPTEVTPAVEPSPETVVETPAPVPDAPQEAVKVAEPTKTETPPVTGTTEPTKNSVPDANESKGDDKPASPKEDRPKSPSFFTKLLRRTTRSGDKKGVKVGKKKEEAPAPTPEEPAEEPSPADAKREEEPVAEPTKGAPAPADPVKDKEIETAPAPAETEVPVPETPHEEPKSGDEKEVDKEGGKEAKRVRSAAAVRRISAIFQKVLPGQRTKDLNHPAKVDEAPPKIEEPTPVAPLENPAADSTPANAQGSQKEETKETNEPPKIINATSVPVVSAAA